MQPVTTEYSGQPKTPTRHSACERGGRCVPLLVSLLLAACDGGSDRHTPAALFADPSPDAASLALEVAPGRHAETGRLLLDWRIDPSVLARAGAGAAPRLRLASGTPVDEPSHAWLRDGALERGAGGRLTLPVATHRLAWQNATLTLELADTDTTALACGAPVPLTDALAASVATLAPAVSRVGERFGEALALSADGGTLALAMPVERRIVLLPADSRDTTAFGEREVDGFALDGLDDAAPGSLRLAAASWGATQAAWWRAADGSGATLAIVEPFGEGWLERARFALPAASAATLHASPDGRRVTLVSTADEGVGIVDVELIDGRWERRTTEGAAGLLAAIPDEGGGLAGLKAADTGGLVLQRVAADASLTSVEPLDDTAGLADRALPHGWQIALHPDGRWLALALLSSDGDAAHAVPELLLFERDGSGWAPRLREQRAPTDRGARTTLAFGGRDNEAALLWQWRAEDATSALATRRKRARDGLVMLVRRPPAAAFGAASRTELPLGWRTAFELPRDGVALSGGAPARAAALSPDGARLAIAWPPRPIPDAADAPTYRPVPTAAADDAAPVGGVRRDPVHPAGHVRLLD